MHTPTITRDRGFAGVKRKWQPRHLPALKCATCPGKFIKTRGRDQKSCIYCLGRKEKFDKSDSYTIFRGSIPRADGYTHETQVSDL